MSLSDQARQEAAEQRIAKAVQDFPIGQRVRYFPVSGRPEAIPAEVRSEPWELGGRIVVLLTGKTGGVSVDHLIADLP